jgi:hypothetical protein
MSMRKIGSYEEGGASVKNIEETRGLGGGAILSTEIYVRHFVSIIFSCVLSADWPPAAC